MVESPAQPERPAGPEAPEALERSVRIAQLARRVRWLDRRRRKIAVAIALLAIPLLILKASAALGADWPRFHTVLLSLMGAAFTWCVVEVGLAWLAAMWETQHAVLVRDRGLPRAELLAPRRKR